MRFCPPPSAAAARRRSISVILADMRLSTKFEDIALPVRARQFKCEFAKLQSPFLQIRLPPMVQNRLYAGRKLSQLRAARDPRQADLATHPGLAASYPSQNEHDARTATQRKRGG